MAPSLVPPSPKSVQSDRVSDKITPYSSSEYAEAERSFSSLRRLKTYLRCCVGQERLSHINHIAVLNVGLHQDELDAVNLCKVGQEFVDTYPSRQHVFGRLISRHIVKQAPVNDRLKQKICALFNLIAEFLGFLSAFSARFTPCRCS